MKYVQYLLDTGPLTAYLLGRQGGIARPDALIQTGEAATSSLVYAEAIEYFQAFSTFGQLQAELRGILHEQVKRLYPKRRNSNSSRRKGSPSGYAEYRTLLARY